jgi:pimeloyl-ACP methyl ester carboxylesterase
MKSGEASRAVAFEGHGSVVVRGEAWGPEEGRPVLFLHGGGQTRHSWSATGRALASDGWHAMALDLRGHGDSDWAPDGGYLPRDFIADLHRVIDALGRPPVVVGASLGGMTALMTEGESEGGRLAALVMVDVTPRLENEGIGRIIDFMLAAPDGFASLEEAGDLVASFRQHRERPKDLSGLRKNLRQGDDGRWRWHWDPAFIGHHRDSRASGLDHPMVPRFNNPERLLAAARSLAIPTMLVRGRESDVVSPEAAREFLQAVPHARFVDVTGAGHMVAGDRNDAFTEAVVEFLRETFS